jgi:hypothetical protein
MEVVTSIIFASKSLQTPKFIILFLWTSSDQILSRFPLKDSTSCLMRMVAHTLTTKIPQVLSRHHHMVPFRKWTSIQNKKSECDLFHFIVSPFSKIPGAPTI